MESIPAREPVLQLNCDRLEWRAVDGQIVVLDLESSTYLVVNRTGAVVWELLAAGAPREALMTRVVEHFEITAQEATGDLDAFLSELESRGLLLHQSAE